MARPLGGIAKLAVVGIVGSLVLSRVLSGRIETRVPIILLFLVFLAAAFALLGVALANSVRATEELEATPRWSLRAAIARLRRRIWAAISRSARRVTAFFSAQVLKAVRATRAGARAGVTRLGEELAPERRRATMAALKRAGRTTLVTLGLPPDDEASQLPNEGLDAMPTLRADWPAGAEGTPRHEEAEQPATASAPGEPVETPATDPE